MEHLLLSGANAPFSIIFFKYVVFQRRQKALLWTKRLRNQRQFDISNSHVEFSLIFPIIKKDVTKYVVSCSCHWHFEGDLAFVIS